MSRKDQHSGASSFPISGYLIAAVGLVLAGFVEVPSTAIAAEPTSDQKLSTQWVEGHASRVRLMVGRDREAANGKSGGSIVAGIEISLDPGFKTYWQNPGEDGGIPPQFDWSKSKNVADTKVFFPAPKRMQSKTGESIGYKHGIVFPVIVTPADDTKPVELKLDAAFGVCSDICIRAEANMALNVPHDLPKGVPAEIAQALEHAPRPETEKRSGDPKLAAHEIVLTGKSPRVVLDVDFGAKPEKGDVFGLAPPGLYLPMAQRVEGQPAGAGLQRFVIDLTKTIDLDDLKGKTVTLTLVGAEGQSEQKLQLQ